MHQLQDVLEFALNYCIRFVPTILINGFSHGAILFDLCTSTCSYDVGTSSNDDWNVTSSMTVANATDVTPACSCSPFFGSR